MDAIGLNAIWLYDDLLYRRTGIVMLAVAADDVSAKRSGDLCMAGVAGGVDAEVAQGLELALDTFEVAGDLHRVGRMSASGFAVEDSDFADDGGSRWLGWCGARCSTAGEIARSVLRHGDDEGSIVDVNGCSESRLAVEPQGIVHGDSDATM